MLVEEQVYVRDVKYHGDQVVSEVLQRVSGMDSNRLDYGNKGKVYVD